MNQVLSAPSSTASSAPTVSTLTSPGSIRPGDPEHSPAVPDLRGRGQRDRNAAAVDHDRQGMPAGKADDALHVDEIIDAATIDRGHEIAGLKSGRCGGAVRLDRGYPRDHRRLAEHHENAGKNNDGENEIGERTGDDDRRPTADRLAEEALLALLLGHRRQDRGVGHARFVVVAEELDVAPERNEGNLPSGAVAVVEAGHFWTEAHREDQHANAAPAGHQEMAELMKENDDRQREQERNNPARVIAERPQRHWKRHCYSS